MMFNIFHFQRHISCLAPKMIVFFRLSHWTVYLCPYQKTTTVHDDYNCPLSMVSKCLAAPAQHLKLQKCGIYSSTTKGLHKGDMSRNWLWFDIETAQWKGKRLWLLEKDPKHPVTPGNNGEDASQFMHYHDSSPLDVTILGSLTVSLTAQWS